MASRVYDELYAEYGRMPTEEEVLLRLERKLGRDRATASAEARNPESETIPVQGPKMRPRPGCPASGPARRETTGARVVGARNGGGHTGRSAPFGRQHACRPR